MTRGKKLTGLCLILAFFSGASFWAKNYYSEDTESDTVESVPVSAVESDSITKLSWTYQGETLSFEKTEGTWEYTEDKTFPLNETQFQTMLETISNVASEKVIDTPEALSEYGLEDGECVIQLSTDTDTLKFIIGDLTSIDQQRYVSIGDGKVYIVSEDILNTFSCSLLDLEEKETVED